MKLPEMLADLPGNVFGREEGQPWKYPLLVRVQTALGCGRRADSDQRMLTSASVHDSQVAIPLATLSTQRVTYCYELMDAAYEAHHITEQSRQLGHVPIVIPRHRGDRKVSQGDPDGQGEAGMGWAEQERYKERTMVERANARLKDEFGGRSVRVRGAVKVMAHLMFGVLALTADQLMKLVK